MDPSNSLPKKIKVLVVDDSALMRQMVTYMLESDPEITVIGTAADPYIAREKIKALNPDVMTLDIQMPRMDGIDFLQKVMSLRPMPVVMVSTLTEKGARVTLDALAIGAVDYITKPKADNEQELRKTAIDLCYKVKQAAKAKMRFKSPQGAQITAKTANYNPRSKLIAIGSSTGGVEALSEIIQSLPQNCPPILIVQHMPEKFTTSFAERLNRLSKPQVVEAQDNHIIQPGTIYIAPGSHHILVAKQAHSLVIKTSTAEPVSGHRPSVDVLFRSIANIIPQQTVAYILTGMGKDGAKGLLELRQKGAFTFGQNEESCLVYGMPKAAKELNATMQELPLNQIAQHIINCCSEDNLECKTPTTNI